MRLQDFVRRGLEDGLQQPAVDILAIDHQNSGRYLSIIIRLKERNGSD
jgi:hypothetical protein